jgi:hypothetical protein
MYPAIAEALLVATAPDADAAVMGATTAAADTKAVATTRRTSFTIIPPFRRASLCHRLTPVFSSLDGEASLLAVWKVLIGLPTSLFARVWAMTQSGLLAESLCLLLIFYRTYRRVSLVNRHSNTNQNRESRREADIFRRVMRRMGKDIERLRNKAPCSQILPKMDSISRANGALLNPYRAPATSSSLGLPELA